MNVLQRVHFSPSAPYPSAVLGPGTESLTPMPPPQRRFVGKPPYDLGRGIRGPSSTGAYTRYAGWDWGAGDDWETGPSRGAGHNLGLA